MFDILNFNNISVVLTLFLKTKTFSMKQIEKNENHKRNAIFKCLENVTYNFYYK